MTNTRKVIFALAGVLLLTALAIGVVDAQEDDGDRGARILANLKIAFPQLADLNVTMGAIEPSGHSGLDKGFFVINGQQQQAFFVTSDDSKLYLVSGEPIDVSRSAEEIAEAVAQREAEEAKKAAEVEAELAERIAGRVHRGPAEAPVTIVEFSDFQCPYCSRGAATVEQILEKYPNDVKFVFQHFPLNFHPWARPAAIASHCAAEQSADAFWTLHDKYFEEQKEITPENVLAKSKEYLAGSDVDMETWSVCAEDESSEPYQAAAAIVDGDMAFGQKLGVSGTPGFFVNGTFLSGAQPLGAFEPLIQAAIEEGG